jgi:hypothetical protein
MSTSFNPDKPANQPLHLSFAQTIRNLNLPDPAQQYKANLVQIRKPKFITDNRNYLNFIFVLQDTSFDSPYHLPDGRPFWTSRFYLPEHPGDPNDKHVRFFKSLVFQTYKLMEYPRTFSQAKTIFNQHKWLWLSFVYKTRTDPDSQEDYQHPYSQIAFPLEQHNLYTNIMDF